MEDGDQPDAKKVAPQNDSFGTQLPPMHQQQSRSVMTEEYKVPDGMVGFIIGRGGEQISRIQQESGCKIQIAPDSGGLPERSCMLTEHPSLSNQQNGYWTRLLKKEDQPLASIMVMDQEMQFKKS